MATPVRDIPPERKTMYYVGMGLTGVGLLLFLSNFCINLFPLPAKMDVRTGRSEIMMPNWFDVNSREVNNHHDEASDRMTGFAVRAVGGMILMLGGSFLMRIGTHGWAGSGVLLDPRQARKDREPMNRATGGMLNDALEEVDVLKSRPTDPTIMIRCRACQAVNDETAKFCNQCGKAL
jgi:hypothetical protein